MLYLKRNAAVVLARYGIPVAIVITVVAALRLYTFTYFWWDDFNNIHYVRNEGFWKLINGVLNPASITFRPLGMLVYWILLQVAPLQSFAYHFVSWGLHALNTALVFLLLRQITKSQYAAGLAVLFFAFRANFGDIYWNFAHIFQLLALSLMLIGLLLYAGFGYSIKETLALTFIMILAIRSEEHGVLFPILCFGYEWLIRRNLNWKQLWVRYGIFVVVMGWFTFFKLATMHDTDPSRPYYLDLSVLTFGRGFGWYFNSLYETNLRWGGWFTISALLAIFFAIRRNGRALFCLMFTYVTLLPYVFLVNHRFDLYLYMPSVGIAGLLAITLTTVQRFVSRVLPQPIATAGLSMLFGIVAVGHFIHEEHRGRTVRGYFSDVFTEYRNFFTDLRALPDAGTIQMLYYRAIPRHMDENTILESTQFALGRTDVETRIVENCPPQGRCFAFEDSHLRPIQ
jgi:hypothetical protein